MTDYTDDFSAAWKAYRSPQNSSKMLAFKAWQKLGRARPSQAVLMVEISCYNKWLEEQSRANGREYPKCHMATWLNQRRYEGFEDDAQAILRRQEALQGHSQADQSAAAKTWHGEPARLLLNAMGPETASYSIMENWFYPCSYVGKSMAYASHADFVEIICPSVFHAQELEKRFGKVIRKAFGQGVKLTVAK